MGYGLLGGLAHPKEWESNMNEKNHITYWLDALGIKAPTFNGIDEMLKKSRQDFVKYSAASTHSSEGTKNLKKVQLPLYRSEES